MSGLAIFSHFNSNSDELAILDVIIMRWVAFILQLGRRHKSRTRIVLFLELS